MGHLPAGDPPALLDRIQVRGVRWEEAERKPIPEVLVLRQGLRLDESHRLLVPRGVVQKDSQVRARADLIDELVQ